MTQTSATPSIRTTIHDLLPAGTFRAGWPWPNRPKEPMVVEYPAHEIEILPPSASYPPPARIVNRHPTPQPIRDEIPAGTFHHQEASIGGDEM